jgi:uncharacterized protein (TIGR00255 family)
MSMTGHGQGMVNDDQVRVLAEVRTVNNRFLKINIISDLGPEQEAQLEDLIRQSISRGSVSLRVQTQFVGGVDAYRLNTQLLQSYAQQMAALQTGLRSVNLEAFLSLPGIVQENSISHRVTSEWLAIKRAVEDALKMLRDMRATEGAAMLLALQKNCDTIANQASEIQRLAPQVVENYARRITERVNQLLAEYQITLQPADLVREVGIFAERCDISEELVRLHSHLDQFNHVLIAEESNGRKLDFLVQEILRETNTIGSKANSAQIASHVIEMKTEIERIREMVQNVE